MKTASKLFLISLLLAFLSLAIYTVLGVFILGTSLFGWATFAIQFTSFLLGIVYLLVLLFKNKEIHLKLLSVGVYKSVIAFLRWNVLSYFFAIVIGIFVQAITLLNLSDVNGISVASIVQMSYILPISFSILITVKGIYKISYQELARVAAEGVETAPREGIKQRHQWLNRIESLKISIPDAEVNTSLNNVINLIKYADPQTNSSVEKIDETIDTLINAINNAQTKNSLLTILIELEKALQHRAVVLKASK